MEWVFEKLLLDARIESMLAESIQLPEIVASESISQLKIPSNTDELNLVLTALSLPTFHPEDTLLEKAKKIAELKEAGCFRDIDIDTQELLTKAEAVTECLREEKECDNLEVELANLHVNKLQRYETKSLQELKDVVKKMESALSAGVSEKEYECAISAVKMGGKVAAQYLTFFKEETKGAYIKHKAMSLLKASSEGHAKVLLMIIENGGTTIEELERALSIDRVSLLKVVYGLCSKNIVDYCRHTDIVAIKK